MTQKEILTSARKQLGMKQNEFADYFGIPHRTLQDWEREERQMPDYLLRLMIYKLEIEKKLKGLQEQVPEKNAMVSEDKRKSGGTKNK